MAPIAPAVTTMPRAERAAAADPVTASPTLAPVERRDAPASAPAMPAQVPARIDRVDEPVIARPHPVRSIELWHERTRVVERLVERIPAGDAAAAVTLVEPAPFAAPARAAAGYEEPVPQRVVHVRIGAIEIHAAPPAPSAPPAPIAAAHDAPAPPSSGFDDFVDLRSYAPWER